MSIIKQLQDTNAKLSADNRKLRAEKQELENDLKIVAAAAAKVWGSLGVKLPSGENDKKPNVMKISLGVVKRLTTGELDVNGIVSKWDEVKPIIDKYPHIVNQ